MRLIGLDPGLRRTGWGVIEVNGNRLRHLDNGHVASDGDAALAVRLNEISEGLKAVLARLSPDAAAIEETFVNRNPVSTLKLGQVRGVVLLAASSIGISVHEYAPNQIKKSLVGAGHADKIQIQAMVRHLLPGVEIDGADAADALAVAICHAHRFATTSRWARAAGMTNA
jgi:crossover junction endodeoxyribonuclease RuvC